MSARSPVPSSSAPLTFDVRPYAVATRRPRANTVRLFLVLWAAFAAGGVAAGYYASSGLFDLLFFGVVALFAGAGALFPALLVASRFWETLASISVDANGIQLRYSRGRQVVLDWDAPGLGLVLDEMGPDHPARVAGLPSVWTLMTWPKVSFNLLGLDAVGALQEVAASRSIPVREEVFQGFGLSSLSRPDLRLRELVISRSIPPVALFDATPGDRGGGHGPTPAGEFPFLPSPRASIDPRGPDRSAPAGSLRFTEAGIEFRTAKGVSDVCPWTPSDRGFAIYRYLDTPLDPAESAQAYWHVHRFRGPTLEGWLAADAYSAVRSAARDHGLAFVTHKTIAAAPKGDGSLGATVWTDVGSTKGSAR